MFTEVEQFENLIGEFYNSKYAVAVDCCTHAIELCLRILNPNKVSVPKHTYLSVPMTVLKLGIDLSWQDNNWENYYYLGNTNIIDAAVYWKQNGYIQHSLMCLSFQYKKHLSTGRGGMILLDDLNTYTKLKQMRYDGRNSNLPWAEQDISMLGYHYYMTPETAQTGIYRFVTAEVTKPRKWSYKDYPDISQMEVFK